MHESAALIRVFRVILLIVLTIGCAIAMAEVYHAFARLWEPWLGAAIFHTILATGLMILSWRGVRFTRPLLLVMPRLIELSNTHSWFAYLPALSILIGAIICALVTMQFGHEAESFSIPLRQWAWILWVPVVEEIVFRKGFGNAFRRVGGWLWGSYFSAILFAWLHADPTLQNVVDGNIFLPLGPLILAVICEGLYLWSQRLGPAIAFHAACNATVVVFAILDVRWLAWLHFLYQTS